MADDTYQGYPNRETWTVNLWLGNNPIIYEGSRAAMQRSGRMGSTYQVTDRTERIGYAALRLKQYVEGAIPDLTDSVEAEHAWQAALIGDLVSAALVRVDWRHLATNWYQETQG